jgi:bifunctional non-homologous end joining protein LigD
MSAEIVRSISLYSDANGSDKVYNVQIVKEGDGFLVNFQNGARLGRMAGGSKTPAPVDMAKAEKKFDALVKEKMNGSSRYRPNPFVEDADNATAAYVAPVSSKVASGAATMMLSEVKDEDHRQALLNDRNFVVEEKYDGVYTKAIVKDGVVTGSNKKGFVVGVYEVLQNALAGAGKTFTIDAEQVGDHLYVFECPGVNGGVPKSTYQQRKDALEGLGIEGSNIHIVRSSGTDRASKLAKIEEVRARGGEGVVFKDLRAPYEDGISKNVIKDKFTASATLVVLEHNTTVRSIVTGATDANGTMVRMKSVTVAPSAPMPAVGAIIEVKYLYAAPGTHALQQPSYKGLRPEQDLSDCVLSQLKYKVALDHDAVSDPQVKPAARTARP